MERSIRNCNVAVIGGAGFLGTHLVKYLIEDRDCFVVVIDNLISGQKQFVDKRAKFVYHDITQSEASLRKIFEVNKIEYVFNYAAEPYIPVSFERPLHVFDINARGALMVLNAAQDAGVKGILQVSSAEIYGKVDGMIKETDNATPHSTYGCAKLAIDTLIQARWKEAKTPAIAMRQFNCYGEHETHEYVIPVIIEQVDAVQGDKGTIKLGNNSFRDFQYAGDAVRMAVELLEKGEFGEVYNMGSQSGIMMYDLAVLIGKLMGKEITVEPDESRMRPWEIWHLQSDNTKLHATIGVKEHLPFEEGLLRTINDYKQNGWCYKN
jgi:UDP-glucose 4-epimerase